MGVYQDIWRNTGVNTQVADSLKAGEYKGALSQWIDKHPDKVDKFRKQVYASGDPRAMVNFMPTYKIGEEAQQLQDIYGDAATGLREAGEQGVDYARSQTNMSQYGGYGEAREAMRMTNMAAVGDLEQASGSSASFLGNVSQMGAQNIQNLRDIAIQNQMFRDQAQRDYMQSLNERIGMETQAAGLEAAGLQAMISEKDKVYESKLNKTRAQQQMEISLAGNALAG